LWATLDNKVLIFSEEKYYKMDRIEKDKMFVKIKLLGPNESGGTIITSMS